MKAAFILATLFAVAPFAASAQEPADFLAVDEPALMDQELSAARGGFEVGGFRIDFALHTLVAVSSVEGATGVATEGVTFAFDQAADLLVINNSLDNVQIAHLIALDIVVNNFSSAVSAASAAGVGVTVPVSYFSLSGF